MGTTIEGAEGYGAIYSVRPDDKHVLTPKIFTGNPNGSFPSGLMLADDGYLYGVASKGGVKGRGTIYKVKRDGTGLTLLHSFDGLNGEIPYWTLLLASDNYLYGATIKGGLHDDGVIYRIKRDGTGFSKVMDFNGSNGRGTVGGLIEGPGGFIYGVSRSGSLSETGLIFKIRLSDGEFTKIFDFMSTDEDHVPLGGVILGSDGRLYGASIGVSNAKGMLYSVRTNGLEFTRIWKFTGGEDGYYPAGPLTEDENGRLYGFTRQGGLANAGVLFNIKKIHSDSTSYIKVLDLYTVGGSQPAWANVVITSTGYLAGMAALGGTDDHGVLFTVKQDGSQPVQLIDFEGSDAHFPNQLVCDDEDNLFGVAYNGGASNNGVIFKSTLDGTYTKLIDFPQGPALAARNLIKASDNKLYGISVRGGAYGDGVIYKMESDGTGFTTLLELNNELTGEEPQTGLIEGTDGYLYGMTRFGGTANRGVIFKLKKDGTNFTKLKDFSFPEGAHPEGNLIQISTGELVGAAMGGDLNHGVIFKINTDGSNYTRIYEFESGTGVSSPHFIMQAQDGKLYGSYPGEGSHGNLYSVKTDGSEFENLFQFEGGNGTFPNCALTQMPSGELFGTTMLGGLGHGVIYKIKPDGSSFAVLHQFQFQNGAAPQFGKLVAGPDGKLYGATAGGGLNGRGTLFKINPDGTGFSNIFDFTDESGAYPRSLDVLIVETENQSITFEEVSDKAFIETTFQLTADATSDLPVTFTSSNPERVTFAGATGSILAPGRITVTATQEGSMLFSAALPVKQTFCVNPAKPVISHPEENNFIVSNALAGNKWFFNGEPIIDGTGESYEATQPGNYSVQVTVDDCVSELSDPVTVSCIYPPTPTISLQGSTTLVSSSETGNQWLLNGDPIENATARNYEATEPGHYSVQVNSNGCLSNESMPVTIVITGIESGDRSSHIKLYPNPVQNEVKISFSSPIIQPVKGTVYDLSGRVIAPIFCRDQETVFDVKNLKPGVYFMKIVQNKNVYIKKFIKK